MLSMKSWSILSFMQLQPKNVYFPYKILLVPVPSVYLNVIISDLLSVWFDVVICLVQGLLTLCGMHDSEAKPVLLCSCNDNSVRVYDLPSFSERGKIFSKQEVRSIQLGPGGLFFTGDGTGEVRVWKWSTEQTATSS
ncbi:unnamed protein product [Ilex paraguariensis]|uniref:Uncharacterized protein n=1 Tax=Ilex paraguariensis TaxID=185542 RepID=A0ABC8QRN4_9AQUA